MNRELLEMLKIVAPGTEIRIGLNNIINGKIGALIVIGNSKEVLDLVYGGFYINCEFTPSNLYELAKMDGGIILNSDCKKILYANTQLLPCSHIISKETGTRHKTAERVAKQTNSLVIAISERRGIITLYKGNCKYILRDINEVLNRANQGIQTLQKYRKTLDESLNNLNVLEFENTVTLYDVNKIIREMEMVWRIKKEIDMYISELGIEGRLLKMQQMELLNGVEKDRVNIIKDYSGDLSKNPSTIWEEISKLSLEELLHLNKIANILGYDSGLDTLDIFVEPKGYRILGKIPRIPSNVLENLILEFDSLEAIINASPAKLKEVEGIGQTRTGIILQTFKKYRKNIQ